MHSTHLRQDSIHGLMMGVAIGNALGLSRQGLSRRTALKMFGRPKLVYRLIPGIGVYSEDTRVMLMTAQALLQSRSDWRCFCDSFVHRLAFYPLSIPVGAGRATIQASLKCWLRATGLASGCKSTRNGPATRAMLLTLALNGTDHRIAKWVEDATRLTHTDTLAVDGCQVLSRLAQAAGTTKKKPLDCMYTLQQAIAGCKESKLREHLSELTSFLEQSRSPTAVARHFGWEKGISGLMLPTTVMACYCFLRFPTNFQRAVQSAIRLGGDTDSVTAIVGGLVGAHIGFDKLPSDLVRRLSIFPHNSRWIAQMADRMAHWPHGVDDLHFAPALASEPLMQLFRNSILLLFISLHLVPRAPFGFLVSSTPHRSRIKQS